jgi:hypothetical protein
MELRRLGPGVYTLVLAKSLGFQVIPAALLVHEDSAVEHLDKVHVGQEWNTKSTAVRHVWRILCSDR